VGIVSGEEIVVRRQKQEAGSRRQEAGGRKQKAESRKQKANFPFVICQFSFFIDSGPVR